jgi:hypothetical protein
VYYVQRVEGDVVHTFAMHKITSAGKELKLGFMLPSITKQQHDDILDLMVREKRLYVATLERGKNRGKQKLEFFAPDEVEDEVDELDNQLSDLLQETFGVAARELQSLYNDSPSEWGQLDRLKSVYDDLATKVVEQEIKEFNSTVKPPVVVEMTPVQATEQLRRVIAHKHMKTIRAACTKLKLNVNDYLYALQEVVDDPNCVAIDNKSNVLHIID